MDTEKEFGVSADTLKQVIDYLLYKYYMECCSSGQQPTVKEILQSNGFKWHISPFHGRGLGYGKV